ncbi:GNAT family N-acetyltransferase [Phytomonospora sp. NPDC050363]|uniref:GNAT family N-acetyltransferase n=1 Tax=Phytomonospora sp. NPDC050363 TaxID=3155642 RepID=UPI0034117E3A
MRHVIRTAAEADYPAVAELLAAAHPYLLTSAEALSFTRRTAKGEPPLELVTEVDGRLAAYASVGQNRFWSQQGALGAQLTVHPDHRRRGIGSAVMDRIEAHIQALRGTTIGGAAVGPDGLAFAEARGFERLRVNRVSGCRLSALPAPPPAPAGIRLATYADFADLRPVYETAMLAHRDIPGAASRFHWEFEEWRADVVGEPRFAGELSTVALDGETVVALCQVQRLDDRVHTNFTATHPGHRGRGLALLVKAHALRAAAKAGAANAYTVNDAENAPMLAVNTRLGYRPHVLRYSVRRQDAVAG